jgi:plasmid stabilization system protein ParE
LERIAMHVEEQFGSEVADCVIQNLEQAFGQLAENPDIGHRREDLTQDVRVRFWSVGPTLVAYR